MARNSSTPSSISSGTSSFLEGLQFTPMNMSSAETGGSSNASLKEVQIQISNQTSTIENGLNQDHVITNEPVRKCLFCGHALNTRSKIAISLSSVTLTIIGIIIIVALFGPIMEDDNNGAVACEDFFYDSNGHEIDTAENAVS